MHTSQLLLYLVMYLVIFFQQNKLTITFNKMVTFASGKSDWSYLPYQPGNHQNELHAKALPVLRFGWSWKLNTA